MTENKIVEHTAPLREEMDSNEETLAVGQWYWVTDSEGCEFGCLTHLGSNHAQIVEVASGATHRIHFDDFDDCDLELNPEEYIDKKVSYYQARTQALMEQVKTLTARLGVAPARELEQAAQGSEARALTIVNSNDEVNTYKADLIKAEKTTLPELFSQIQQSNEEMACWMKAKVIPLKAQASMLKGVLKKVHNRIFSVELYAGLKEDIEQFADGKPAPLETPIHLLQRRHYMDEECLARYEVGGMEFEDIHEFNKWMARPENRDRLLPFPRCVVAFRVRRNTKERKAVTISDFFQICNLVKADQSTFLYIRNGEQLSLLQTDIEFDEKMFPDMEQNRVAGKLWVARGGRGGGRGYQGLITDDQYQGLVEDDASAREEWEANKLAADIRWEADKAKAVADGKDPKSVYKEHHFEPPSKAEGYKVYDRDNVYFDDVSAVIKDDVQKHNQLVLVLQGLLDRSPIFHPHPPWQLWSNEGFAAALELVYDDDRALAPADLPDFEAYCARLNSKLKAGDVTVGQEDYWESVEAEKESRRRDNDYCVRSRQSYPHRFRPFRNPGPGLLAKAEKVTRTGKVTFSWMRERLGNSDRGSEIRTSITCHQKHLLNVSAYVPGDYRQFCDDPRTRKDYMEWAPMLLEAEEYHAGNREVLDPPPPKPKPQSTHEGKVRYANRKFRKNVTGRVVRLTRNVRMENGTVYLKGSPWRVTGGKGAGLHLVALLQTGDIHDGEIDWQNQMDDVWKDTFEVDDTFPRTDKYS